MANWLMHVKIAEEVLKLGLDVDEKGFVIGSIGPDCNVENEDWTAYTPSKEITHWMKVKDSKYSVDYDAFYKSHILDKTFTNDEEYAFLLGYYGHLITDLMFQQFVRDEERVRSLFVRLKEHEEYGPVIEGYPENFDTVKMCFGKGRVFGELYYQHYDDMIMRDDALYPKYIHAFTEFPEYLSYFPKGAITRKLKVMSDLPTPKNRPKEYVIFTEIESRAFVEAASQRIYDLISKAK